MTVSSTIDFDEVAARTVGFSGADLQALLYNAHLDVIHASIADTPAETLNPGQTDDTSIQYVTLGGSAERSVLSKAEEMAIQRRASESNQCLPSLKLTLFCA